MTIRRLATLVFCATLPCAAAAQQLQITEAYACEVPAGCAAEGGCVAELTPLRLFFARLPDGGEGLAVMTPAGTAPAFVDGDLGGERLIRVGGGSGVSLVTLRADLTAIVSRRTATGTRTHDALCREIGPGAGEGG